MVWAWCCKQVGEMVSPTSMCPVDFTFYKSKSVVSVKEVTPAILHRGRNQGIWLHGQGSELQIVFSWLLSHESSPFLLMALKQGGLRCYSKAIGFLFNYVVNHKDLECSFNSLLTNRRITIYGMTPHPSMFTRCTVSSMWCPSTGTYNHNYRKDRYSHAVRKLKF